MTDRVKALTVVLKDDIRVDDIDVESIVSAIKMVKGVLDVKLHTTDISDHVARERVKAELISKLFKALE